jgi:hypothetical protein
VTAETLYEAVALGVAAIRTDDWVTDIAQGLNPVKVQVKDIPVEHEVRMMDFTNCLDRKAARHERSAIGGESSQSFGYRSDFRLKDWIEKIR